MWAALLPAVTLGPDGGGGDMIAMITSPTLSWATWVELLTMMFMP